jgi:phage tail sheath gpL-like
MAIPTTLRVPFVYVEFDSSRAFQGPNILKYKALLVGELLAAGSKSANEIVKVTSADQAATYFGAGSVLHRMFISWFANNKTVEVYGQGLAEATGAQGTVDLVITGNATADGTIYLYVAGKQIQVAVSSGDTPTVAGDAMVALVNADTTLPVTSANVTGTVTFTAKNKGTIGNDIDVRINYNDGEELPAGETVTVGGAGHQGLITGGTGTPAGVATAIAAWGDEWYNVFGTSITDATNIALFETELTDRFGPIRMIDGLMFASVRDTLSNLETYGNARNSPHVVVIENGGVNGIGSPSTSFEKAAATVGRVASEAEADPARPFQTLELVGILAPVTTERFTLTERNGLLFDGIATSYVDAAGKVRIERVITTYQTNAAGAADVAYLDANTLLTLMYLRYDFRTTILTKYPRAKLANDGVQVAPGQVVMTPSVGKAEAVAIFRNWESLGLVENIDQFKTDLVVQRNASDVNRMDWILPPDLINQLRVNGATIQFLLESPSL